MLRQYSQFFIKSVNFSLGIFKKKSNALNFLISAYVSIGAMMTPIISIIKIDIITVILVVVMLLSAWVSDY